MVLDAASGLGCRERGVIEERSQAGALPLSMDTCMYHMCKLMHHTVAVTPGSMVHTHCEFLHRCRPTLLMCCSPMQVVRACAHNLKSALLQHVLPGDVVRLKQVNLHWCESCVVDYTP
jgi:hypothetical protein